MARGGKGGHTPHRPHAGDRRLAGLIHRGIRPQQVPTMGGAASTGGGGGKAKAGNFPFRAGGSPHDRKTVSNLLKEDRSLRKPFRANKKTRKLNPIEERRIKRK